MNSSCLRAAKICSASSCNVFLSDSESPILLRPPINAMHSEDGTMSIEERQKPEESQATSDTTSEVEHRRDFGFFPIPPSCRVDSTGASGPFGYSKVLAFAFASTFSKCLYQASLRFSISAAGTLKSSTTFRVLTPQTVPSHESIL